MVGAMTMLAYVNSVSPSCVYFITLHRLHKQTRAESEHLNQNQKTKITKACPMFDYIIHIKWTLLEIPRTIVNVHQFHASFPDEEKDLSCHITNIHHGYS